MNVPPQPRSRQRVLPQGPECFSRFTELESYPATTSAECRSRCTRPTSPTDTQPARTSQILNPPAKRKPPMSLPRGLPVRKQLRRIVGWFLLLGPHLNKHLKGASGCPVILDTISSESNCTPTGAGSSNTTTCGIPKILKRRRCDFSS